VRVREPLLNSSVIEDAPPRVLGRDRLSLADCTSPMSTPAGTSTKLTDRPRPHVLQVFQPLTGGVRQYAANLTEGLLAAGWRVSVACPPAAEVAERLQAAGAQILPLDVERSPRAWQDARAVRKLARWCRENDVALIHGHSTKASLLVALTARRAGIPSVYTPHGWAFQMRVHPALRAAYALFERQLAHRCHATVFAVSASERAAAERWRVAPRGRIQVIRTGLPQAEPAITRSAARRELSLPDDAVVAVWVGRVGAQKRPQDLAQLARKLAGTVTVLTLCEGLEGTALADELRACGVILAPARCEPAMVYAAADLALMTSDWESFPLVVLEAMAARLPVVSYSVGGISEQVRAGRTGYLVRPGDIETMSECVLTLAENAVLRERMGDAGHLRAASLFDSASMLERTMQAYLNVVPGR
jgi:glycosyltransferase involved in cell wall biosynthesis